MIWTSFVAWKFNIFIRQVPPISSKSFWNASNSCQYNMVGVRESGSGRVYRRWQAALSEGFRDLSTYVPYFLIILFEPKKDSSA